MSQQHSLSVIACSTLLLACALLAGRASAQADSAPQWITPAHRWALVVGAGDYEHLGRLSYATRDAKAFADGLVEKLGFERDTVRLLTDDAEDPAFTPTAGHVIGELKALLADRRRNRSDLFVFYFCGHGVGRDEGDFLLPTDARVETVTRVGVSVTEVIECLTKAEMRNVLVVVDACREGAKNPFGRELDRLAEERRLAVVLGCEPGGQSYEDSFLGHGAFTYFLLQSLGKPELRDPVSGALWASRVAKDAAASVSNWSADKAPPQQPACWHDVTRDVLLAAAPPTGDSSAGLARFLDDVAKLDPQARIAALGGYAEAFCEAGKLNECIEVLKAAEQLGDLPTDLQFMLGMVSLGLGRASESASAFEAVRRADPGSFLAQMATVVDWSGAVAPGERAQAAGALWRSKSGVPPGLLVHLVGAALAGGAAADGLAMTEAALAGKSPDTDTRATAFLRGARAAFRGQEDEAVEALEKAQHLAGTFPGDEMLLLQRIEILGRTRGPRAQIDVVDACVARWPDQGRWLALRAHLRRLAAQDPAEFEQVFADARAALALPLGPAELMLATQALRSRASELAAEIEEQAARHPQAWQAQLAALYAADHEPGQESELLDQVVALAPRPSQVYVSYADLLFNGALDLVEREGPGPTPETGSAGFVDDCARGIVSFLAPQAGEFGDDAGAWNSLWLYFGWLGEYEACFRLLDRHLGRLVDAGTLPIQIAASYARACLDTGRWDRFRELRRSVVEGSLESDTLAWLAACFLAARGEDQAARAELGARTVPRDPDLAPVAAPLRALLAARTGPPEQARRALPAEDPADPFALALTGLAARAAGDAERAARVGARLEQLGAPLQGYFACAAFRKSDPNGSARALAWHAALEQPGNPLLRDASFAAEPRPASFEAAYDLRILADAANPAIGDSMDLTLTVLQGGRVRGTMLSPPDEEYVVQGRIDAFGNLEAEIKTPEGRMTLLAKLAPLDAYAAPGALQEQGQPLLFLDPSGIPHRMFAKPNKR